MDAFVIRARRPIARRTATNDSLLQSSAESISASDRTNVFFNETTVTEQLSHPIDMAVDLVKKSQVSQPILLQQNLRMVSNYVRFKLIGIKIAHGWNTP